MLTQRIVRKSSEQKTEQVHFKDLIKNQTGTKGLHHGEAGKGRTQVNFIFGEIFESHACVFF